MSDDDTDEAVENSDGSADADAGNQSPSDNTFDLTLATTHSYLGNDLEVLRGRTLLDNGIYLNLPLLFEKSVILFPEQTLPMVEYSQQIVNMLRSSIDKDRTFGVVCSGLEKDVLIGTTAEIYEYSDSDPDGFRIKAKGRQRFKILRVRNTTGRILADVKILPEIVLGPPFFEERLASLDRLRTIPKTESEAKELEYRVSRRDSAVTPWPSWVYRQYDSRRLAMKIHNCLNFLETRGSNIPEDPVKLSFWVAHNLMKDTAKIALLQYDCAISRLQYEAQVLSMLREKAFVCSTCSAFIGKHTDIVPMNKEGLQEAYCNPSGAIHETVTLYEAKNLVLNRERPSTLCSWFPGYAWTIATCSDCGFHVGWLFTAVNKDLRPRQFWGLSRKSLVVERLSGDMSTKRSNPTQYGNERRRDFRRLAETLDTSSEDDDGEYLVEWIPTRRLS